ncbi:MAG: glycosyltransferase family 4 protein [Steroidobacteraceae bacterium]
MRRALLIMIHCEERTGYAIAPLEDVFYRAGRKAGFDEGDIVWSFNGLKDVANPRKIDCSYRSPDSEKLRAFLRRHRVATVLAFDMPVPAPVLADLRREGVRRIVSYWGASMSGINKGAVLAAKRLEYSCRRYKPDLFIFESEAMRETATHGRGVPQSATRVVRLGVDTDAFRPREGDDFYLHDQFNIPRNRKVAIYSGHMEERKGVRVIMKAALQLGAMGRLSGIHFLICGNKGDEARPYEEMLDSSEAKQHVTFAGYRSDMGRLLRGAHVGVIASTGWDSFTMSSVEMMASGLPLVVSNLGGLGEAVEVGLNGYTIEPGNAVDLAGRVFEIANDDSKAAAFSQHSRERAIRLFGKDRQIAEIASLIV